MNGKEFLKNYKFQNLWNNELIERGGPAEQRPVDQIHEIVDAADLRPEKYL